MKSLFTRIDSSTRTAVSSTQVISHWFTSLFYLFIYSIDITKIIFLTIACIGTLFHRFRIPYSFSVSVSVSISVIPFSEFRFPDSGFLVWVLPWGHAKQWHLTWKLKSSRLKLRKKRSSSKGVVTKKVSANWSRLYLHFQGDEAIIENGGTLLNKIYQEYFVKNALIVTLETAAWNCLELNLSVSMPDEHEERVRWRRPSCSAVLAGH